MNKETLNKICFATKWTALIFSLIFVAFVVIISAFVVVTKGLLWLGLTHDSIAVTFIIVIALIMFVLIFSAFYTEANGRTCRLDNKVEE